MQARAPLMIEHRLIERMLSVIREKLTEIEAEQQLDPLFVETVVDFIMVYADQTHHGKEEDILFRALEKRPLSEEDRLAMNELIAEHVFGRETTAGLRAASIRYRNGETAALAEIVDRLKTLIDFYPVHIEKEDKSFFPAARKYFSEEEDQAMLAEFREFDRRMIHAKYKAVVDGLTPDM